ncbi:MAG: hypothetical protein JHC33_01350 [Ignisphaera sp.]|nr:hypothetical protein [Ignisphaera sp.]
MTITIENLRDTFQIGYNAYLESRKEANLCEDYYHNRQYTTDQLSVLADRGQPKETFNIVKLFSRQLLGYYSTLVNTIKVNPIQYSDIDTAALLNDVANEILRDNSFSNEADAIKLDGFLSGLLCSYIDVVDSGDTDKFGRKIYNITLERVPSSEIVLDPMSIRADSQDARFIHRHKWFSEEGVVEAFGKGSLSKLQSYRNTLNAREADFEFKYGMQFMGQYRLHKNYLIVHSIIKDDDGDSWSVYWSDFIILDKKKITYKDVKFPYRVVKISDSNKSEYYGIFRDVMESQNAINQAIIQIQQMANSNKAFVEDGAVENIADFTKAFNRVNSVIPVTNLSGIKIDSLSGDIQQQYLLIDKAFNRIQRILGINDSFLGMAYASDSGRKVQLQQNASMVALRYLTTKLELYYKMVGWDVVNLIKQYYTANQVLRISDELVGQRWIELNKPIMLPDSTGKLQPVMDESIDPASGEPNKDHLGNIIMVPLNDSRTDISFSKVDLEITTSAYDDSDEQNDKMLNGVLNGNLGNALMTVNPAGYMKLASLSMKSLKSRYSSNIADILDQTSQMLTPQPHMQSQLGGGANVSSQLPQGGQQSQQGAPMQQAPQAQQGIPNVQGGH